MTRSPQTGLSAPHGPHDHRPDIEALSRCAHYVAAIRTREYLFVTLSEG
jgi:hypothetical protein